MATLAEINTDIAALETALATGKKSVSISTQAGSRTVDYQDPQAIIQALHRLRQLANAKNKVSFAAVARRPA